MKWHGLLIVCVAALVAGCQQEAPMAPIDEEFDRPLPPGQLALVKITDPAELPDLLPACRNTLMLDQAVQRSLHYMGKPSSRTFFPYGDITHAHAVASLEAMRELLAQNLPPEQLAEQIRSRFDVYTSVGWDGRGTVLYTGYYAPVLQASRQREGPFQYPLYGPPEGLVKDPLTGEVKGLREASGQLRPLPARRDLPASGLLDGRELVYLADPFEVYVAHVQGSAILRMRDGSEQTIGYAASNGHEYRSVGAALIRDGKIEKNKMSLQAMIAYFKANPQEVESYVNRNPRFIFFQLGTVAPTGSLNEPVTPWRSIATDKDVYPRACLAMVASPLPRRVMGRIETLPYSGFALDQDTGGAIRAPGRCDIYLGIGQEAGELAGRTYHKGRLYYLFLKPSLLPAGATASR